MGQRERERERERERDKQRQRQRQRDRHYETKTGVFIKGTAPSGVTVWLLHICLIKLAHTIYITVKLPYNMISGAR